MKNQLTSQSRDFKVRGFFPGEFLLISYSQKRTRKQEMLGIFLFAPLLLIFGVITSTLLGMFRATALLDLALTLLLVHLLVSALGWGIFIKTGHFQIMTNRILVRSEKGVEIRYWESFAVKKELIPASQMRGPKNSQPIWAENGGSFSDEWGFSLYKDLNILALINGEPECILAIRRAANKDVEAEVSALNELFATFRDTFREDFVVEPEK